MKSPLVIAEIGCNHKGDMLIAKEMIRTARDFCKVNVVKFQKRTVKDVLTAEEYNSPHPNPQHSYGATYGAHREYLEFDLHQHMDLKDYCESLGVIYSASVWDLNAARDIASLEPEFIKVPSATNTNWEVIDFLCTEYRGKIHLSLGMTTSQEEEAIVERIANHERLHDLVLYACTSGYPVPPEDTCLLEVSRLKERYTNKVHAIGFSGHHNGIALDIAAYTLGATFIERHFTLDRTWKGTDHAASLEPDGLRRLNRDLHNVHVALKYKEKELLGIELEQREKLKWDRQINGLPGNATIRRAYPEKDLHESGDVIQMLLLDVDGVLTDGGMYYAESGDELKKFNTRDGEGIRQLREAGIKVGIVTKESTKLVERRAAKLGIDILHQGVSDKLRVVKELEREYGLTSRNIAYIGDDSNDYEVLGYVGFSAVPNDADVLCKQVAKYICNKKGGEGCVREVANMLLQGRAEQRGDEDQVTTRKVIQASWKDSRP